MLTEVTAHLANVEIDAFEGLLVDFAMAHGVDAFVKGLRAVSDFDVELQMAQMNERMSGIATLFFPTAAGALVPLVQPRAGGRPVRRRRIVDGPRAHRPEAEGAFQFVIISDRHNEAHDTEVLLRRVLDLVNSAPKMPLSSTVRLEKDEVVEMLEEAISRLPEEMRQARWLLKERQEYLAKVQREGDEILNAARERAERIVQRTELVREAQRVANRTLEEANDEARKLKHEAEDYVDQKLASFEIVLERIMKTVVGGREKLRVAPLPESSQNDQTATDADPDTGEVFFDQDQW